PREALAFRPVGTRESDPLPPDRGEALVGLAVRAPDRSFASGREVIDVKVTAEAPVLNRTRRGHPRAARVDGCGLTFAVGPQIDVERARRGRDMQDAPCPRCTPGGGSPR